jgi:hypothetical protein
VVVSISSRLSDRVRGREWTVPDRAWRHHVCWTTVTSIESVVVRDRKEPRLKQRGLRVSVWKYRG